MQGREKPGLTFVLLHDDRPLRPDQVLQDCGITSGATLTLIRDLQSQLQLEAFACGDFELANEAKMNSSFFSWVSLCASPSGQLCSDAVAWCRKFAEECMDGACGAVCSLQNPECMQCLVDNGEVSKVEAVHAILANFTRSLLATCRVCSGGGSGKHGAGDAYDNEAVTAILREHLPETTRGVNLLKSREPCATNHFEKLSELYLQYISEKHPGKLEFYATQVKEGLSEVLRIEAHEDMPMKIWSDEDGLEVGWRRFLCLLDRSCTCTGSDQWCDDCCKDGWMHFLKSVHRPGNMWFQIDSDEIFNWGTLIYCFGVGVYLEGQETAPNQLPTHYIFQFARTD